MPPCTVAPRETGRGGVQGTVHVTHAPRRPHRPRCNSLPSRFALQPAGQVPSVTSARTREHTRRVVHRVCRSPARVAACDRCTRRAKPHVAVARRATLRVAADRTSLYCAPVDSEQCWRSDCTNNCCLPTIVPGMSGWACCVQSCTRTVKNRGTFNTWQQNTANVFNAKVEKLVCEKKKLHPNAKVNGLKSFRDIILDDEGVCTVCADVCKRAVTGQSRGTDAVVLSAGSKLVSVMKRITGEYYRCQYGHPADNHNRPSCAVHGCDQLITLHGADLCSSRSATRSVRSRTHCGM